MSLIINQFKDKTTSRSGVIMLISLLIIAGSLIIALSIASLVMIAIDISHVQSDSVQAYFAADSGVERILFADRTVAIDQWNCQLGNPLIKFCCKDRIDGCIFFDQVIPGYESRGIISGCYECEDVQPNIIGDQANNVSYQAVYRGVSIDNSSLYVDVIGQSNGVKRSIKLTIKRTSGCIPKCSDGGITYECGNNGCNGFCGYCRSDQKCVNYQCVDM